MSPSLHRASIAVRMACATAAFGVTFTLLAGIGSLADVYVGRVLAALPLVVAQR